MGKKLCHKTWVLRSEPATMEVKTHPEEIWRALFLWISKPSAYNKSVGTVELIYLNRNQSPDPYQVTATFFEQSNWRKMGSYAAVRSSLSSILVEEKLKQAEPCELNYRESSWLIVRFNVPKTGVFRPRTIDLVSWDFNTGEIEFHALRSDDSPTFESQYTITFDGKYVEFYPKLNASLEQLRTRDLLFAKVQKWSQNRIEGYALRSLSLVSQEEYYVLYNELKKKYSGSIRKIWTESTDPDKFIHEDVAIATYLILVWGKTPQTFVDLGCGNGLLVHILSEEGHKGLGIDVRSRKIWGKYPKTTVLKEETIVPSLSYVFPDIDWIIGNHSDELTPWIPVISLLSSVRTNFFLLPCCAYEFNGDKFKRTSSTESQYMEYLNYVEAICSECGFEVVRDRLKIPSTKRICFVSTGRTEDDRDAVIDKMKRNIKHRCGDEEFSNERGTADERKFLRNFKPRDSVEKVRNCTQLNKEAVSSLIAKISALLLRDMTHLEWCSGSPTELPLMASQLTAEERALLKNECGGLQTLLRNHRFIFQISGGKVTFRKPTVLPDRPSTWKSRACWFYVHHPQSCPLGDDDCSFIHQPQQVTSS